MGPQSKDDETVDVDVAGETESTTAASSILAGIDISDLKNPSSPSKPLFRDVFALEWSREFPKSVLRACGVWPTERERLTVDEKKKAWFTSLLVSFAILAVSIGMLALSMSLFFNGRFAYVWLPNAVVIGSLCSAVNWRTRVLVMPSYYVVNMAANFLRHKPWRVALSVPWANQIEITLITCTTLMLASAYSRKPGIELDFTYAGHVASFFISLVFTPIRAVLCAWILRTYFGPDPAVDGAFGTEIVQWLDLAPICLMVPFFVSVVRVRPCLVNLIRTNPIRSILFAGILFLSAFPPVVISLCMARYATSATILGFYISWPLISVCAPLAGVAGVTSCLVVTGFSTLIYIPFADYSQLALKISVVQYRQDQIFWAQICIVVMVFSSLIFNVVLSWCERAKADVEEQVSIRTKELSEARARAEEADKNKAAFIHFLCHELRNPLHAVSNLTEILIEEKAEAKKEKGEGFAPEMKPSSASLKDRFPTTSIAETSDPDPVHAIHLCTNYMLALLSDVLDVGRFENGAVKLETQTVDLHGVLEGVTTMAKARAGAKGLQFKAEISPSIPKWVECDPLRLQQVINNLLSNSFKFTPTGGTVTLTVDLQPVLDPDVSIGDIDPDRSTGTISLSSSLHSLNEISLDEDSFVTVPMTPLRRSTITGSPRPKPKFHLRVRCSDTGIGIHHSALATLFDPWTQAPKTSSAEYGGSGLGLSIASQIVRLMGGEIGAASEAGKGAEFEFWIPLKGSWEPSLAVESESERGTRERHSGRMVQGAVAEPLAEVVVVKSSPVSEATEMLSPVSEVPSSSSSGTLVPPEQSPSISPQVLDYFKPSSRRRKVLVTDDSPINRRILVRLLSVSLKKLYPNDQWTVEEAGDGTEAVEAVRRDLEGPNELELCFMDVVMPIMDGYTATSQIRTLLEPHPERKLAIVVASANKVGKDEWQAAGADGAISKPFGKKEVEEVLSEYC